MICLWHAGGRDVSGELRQCLKKTIQGGRHEKKRKMDFVDPFVGALSGRMQLWDKSGGIEG